MTSPILATKLYIPPVRPNIIPRPRLIEELNKGLHRKLTLISAPAGFGKTTLISEWLQLTNLPTAWLSLDENDNDLTRFLTYFVAALQQIEPEIGQTIQAVLQSPQPPSVENLIALLINEIIMVSTKFAFTLDDYHVIEAEPIHKTLTFLLDHLPPQIHVVITSRADPPLSLSRLRGRGQMTELRADNLRFTVDEATTFLNEVMGLNLSAKDVHNLEARTEGWITGLQLAALSMQGRDDTVDFIKNFTGSHRYVLDYLADEVLGQRPEGTRRFLLQTSILDRLCGPLCDVVTQQDNSQAILETLDVGNLFIVPLDDQRHWYRYHHLFGDLLQHYLQRDTDPAELVSLHQRAYDWYFQNEFPEEALEHALIVADYDRVIHLLERLFWQMIMRGEISTLNRWLRKLPDELVRSQPRLSLFCAWTLLASLLLAEVDAYVKNAEHILLAKPDREQTPTKDELNLLGEIDAIRAFLTRVRGNASEAIDLYRRAHEQISADHSVVRGVNLVDLGRAYVMIDDVSTAKQTLAEAIELNQAIGSMYMVLYAVSVLAEVEVSQGRLHQATERYQQILQHITATGEPLPPLVGTIYAGLAQLHREWNDLAQAENYASKAIELGERYNFPDGLFQGYLALGRIKQAQGKFDTALQAFREAERIIRQSQTAQWTISVTAYQARLRLMQYQLDGDDKKRQAGTGWAQTSALSENWHQQVATAFLPSHPPDFEHLTLARVFMAQDHMDEALNLLDWLLQAAETGDRFHSVIEILILQALALYQNNQTEQALSTLTRALLLAEPEGYVRLFVDEGPPLAELLAQLPSSSYSDKLFTAFPSLELGNEKVAKWRSEPQNLVEPLSNRELEVLALIADGMSNREIAETLVISVGTVKRHVTNIHGKLGVQSRTQAVAKARELNLLF